MCVRTKKQLLLVVLKTIKKKNTYYRISGHFSHECTEAEWKQKDSNSCRNRAIFITVYTKNVININRINVNVFRLLRRPATDRRDRRHETSAADVADEIYSAMAGGIRVRKRDLNTTYNNGSRNSKRILWEK